MFSPVINLCQSYYHHLPDDTLQTVSKSAAFTFSIAFVLGSPKIAQDPINMLRPLVAAGIAALASLIHALMTPLFDGMFGDRKINFFRETIKWVIVSACTTLIVNKLLAAKIELVALPQYIPLSINYLKGALGTFPDMLELFDPQRATEIRDMLRPWGFIGEEGSNSIYIMPTLNLKI
jgi:hypothetical protein